MLWLPNAEVIVDNGVLRTAADAGLSRIWGEIYSGGKRGGWLERRYIRPKECEGEGMETARLRFKHKESDSQR